MIVGYKTYIRLLGDLAAGKEVISSGMTEEIKRAGAAIQKSREGENVCLVSSGDPGVYGMAGLVLELLSKEEESEVKIEIIPGIMAATGCASILGAPLMNDFALISLSDLLTDKQVIKQRIKMAAKGDFVIVFYNPRSKKRTRLLKSAWQILMEHKSPHTPVGLVRNGKRENEEVTITTLENMLSVENIDMLTTIVVGNSQTYLKGRYMITPRGYNLREMKNYDPGKTAI